ncbi:MAG: glycosyltransferase family 39 protein [bacterium]|nr:glycosyltransferase family 39 protein [bacterium]
MIWRKISIQIIHIIFIIILGISSFIWAIKAGERGFFPFDQSIVFDGGYRILSGQIPFKDFILPFGPTTLWIQAIFFKLFGINYFSYILNAAVINVLATLGSILILYFLFPKQKYLAYLCGIITLFWFQPPFGTPWFEQTAFFFAILSIITLLGSMLYNRWRKEYSSWGMFISGVSAFLSFLSKQNVGLSMFSVYLLFLLFPLKIGWKQKIKHTLFFLTGVLCGIVIFTFWLWRYADISIFMNYFFIIPLRLGISRLGNFKTDFFPPFDFAPKEHTFISLITFSSATYIISLHWYNLHRGKKYFTREIYAGLLGIGLLIAQYLFTHTTNNQPENGAPFIGIIAAIGIGLWLRISSSLQFRNILPQEFKRTGVTISIKLILGLILLWLVIQGISVGLNRNVHDVFTNSKFPHYCVEDKLSILRWGNPTHIYGRLLKEEDFVYLLNYLKQQNKSVFIFPDYTIIYGLLNLPSPQPVLWFHKDLTYSLSLKHNELDNWIVNDLKKNGVELVVLEDISWLGTNSRLDDFPYLKQYIIANFKLSNQIGMFYIFHKKV